MERVAVAPEERQPVHVYVDEFHEFATAGLARFLAAARKCNVGLTLAHQRLAALHPLMREAILGAVGHVVLFRQGADDGFGALPRLVWPRFGEQELLSLTNYGAVARVTSATGEARLGRLKVPRPESGDASAVRKVRFLTRLHFAWPRRKAETQILKRLRWQPSVHPSAESASELPKSSE